MKRWTTLEREYIYQSSFGNLRKDRCKTGNGIIIDEYYINEYADWVNAIVVTEENQLVLVEQYRYGADDFFLEVPAGKVEKNESAEEGIVREVREETGYVSEKSPIKLGEFLVNPATQNNRVITYLLEDAVKEFNQNLDDTEEINVHVLNFNDMGELLRNNEINTQLFTANAYFMANFYLNNRVS